tara:strand:+ start:1639 stop:1896 length:258 start_codon:yes stop_codon:yes gene_type:complete
MENIKVRCRSCNRELEGHPTKTVSCGCPNMTTVRGDKISAVDLSHVIMLNSAKVSIKSSIFSNQDLEFQEARRRRKVRKLNFEVR